MLVYYHGADAASINAIMSSGVDINRGSGELGKGFYVGSSLWRAFSWAWMKAHKNGQDDYCVIRFEFSETDFLKCKILCKNRSSALYTYNKLEEQSHTRSWTSGHDAIWAPIVGKNIQNVYQIKFESVNGQNFINEQKREIICKRK